MERSAANSRYPQWLVCVLGVLLPAAATAHHSFALYDQQRLLTAKGTVADWKWTNPHVELVVTVPGANGATQRWVLAGQAVSTWARIGMQGQDVHVGDSITVQFNAAKDGSNRGYFQAITVASGRTFGEAKVAAPSTGAPAPGKSGGDIVDPLEAPR